MKDCIGYINCMNGCVHILRFLVFDYLSMSYARIDSVVPLKVESLSLECIYLEELKLLTDEDDE